MAKKITTIEEDIKTPEDVVTPDVVADKEEVVIPEKPEVDIDKIVADAVAQAEERTEKRITDRLVNSLAPKEEEFQHPWDKEGRAPTYEEALTFVKEEAKKDLKAEEEALRKQLSDKEEAEKNAELTSQQQIVKTWEQQEKELISAGKLTEVKDPNNEQDPGVQELKEFYNQFAAYNKEQQSKGGRPINNIKEFFYEQYKAPTKPELPVNRGQGRYVNTEDANYTRKEIRSAKSIFDFFKGN